MYTNPVIEPLGQAKSDAQILCELAEALGLDDELLKSGYENCIRYMIRNLSVTVEDLKANPLPTLVPERKPYQEGAYIRGGLDTKSGKFELDSSLIKDHPEWGLDSLPTYCDSLDGADEEKYPFALCAGARIPNAIHSRLHEVPWVRSLRPHPTADISLEDGKTPGNPGGGRYGDLHGEGQHHREGPPHSPGAPGDRVYVPRLPGGQRQRPVGRQPSGSLLRIPVVPFGPLWNQERRRGSWD